MPQNVTTATWIGAMSRAAEKFGLPADSNFLQQQMSWFAHLPPAKQLDRLSRLLGVKIKPINGQSVIWKTAYCRFC
ncbi:Uncharacterised protein [Budvicia aquatica]|uniref:Uncharacterized protein n=1 Tax=Budvicia aquatica TaxID=82979 RepID=A0A484ZMQ9_9GAMM|nr:Uncharacterised protein [Budvicia aquatica]